MTPFVFDGSFEGFLTAIFDVYCLKPQDPKVFSERHYQPGLLDEPHFVVSDQAKAGRVWSGLTKKLRKDWQSRFYNTFLSETTDNLNILLDFARYVFDNPKGAENDYGNASVIAVSKIDRSVNRERHRMKAFIRFQETSDGIFYAPVEPDFNVLPLIAGFFKSRYADQRWIIYDLRRNYGLYYNLDSVSEITLDSAPEFRQPGALLDGEISSDKEGLYGLLWNDYFKSTNIPARKNMKLHIRHVPKRYWKFLTEKQVPETAFFIAVTFEKNIAGTIIEIQKEVAMLYESSKALRTEPHITLKAPFKITSDHEKNLLHWFENNDFGNSFTLTLNGFGTFDNPENPVLFIKPDVSDPLKALQTKVIESFSKRFPGKTQRHDSDFSPHITIAFRDLSSENFARARKEFIGRSLNENAPVKHITLFRHDGTKWTVAARSELSES